MTIKLLAIDIDGTLINSRYEVTDKTKAAIRLAQQRHVHVVLCTGRPYLGARRYVEALGMHEQDAYVITYNGALIQQTHTQNVVRHVGLSGRAYKELTQLAEYIGVHCHALDFEAIYTSNCDMSRYTGHDSYFTTMPIRYRTLDEIADNQIFTKMMFIDEPAVLDAALANIPSSFYNRYTIFKSEPFYCEILNKHASKGKALQQVAAALHIDPHEVMAIGDHPNDLDMVQYAGIGVAMGNAVESIKAAANFVTTTNNEDGVAKAIEAHILT